MNVPVIKILFRSNKPKNKQSNKPRNKLSDTLLRRRHPRLISLRILLGRPRTQVKLSSNEWLDRAHLVYSSVGNLVYSSVNLKLTLAPKTVYQLVLTNIQDEIGVNTEQGLLQVDIT